MWGRRVRCVLNVRTSTRPLGELVSEGAGPAHRDRARTARAKVLYLHYHTACTPEL